MIYTIPTTLDLGPSFISATLTASMLNVDGTSASSSDFVFSAFETSPGVYGCSITLPDTHNGFVRVMNGVTFAALIPVVNKANSIEHGEITIPAPDAGQVTAYIHTYDGQGNLLSGVELEFQLVDIDTAGQSFARDIFTATSGSDGLLTVPLVIGGEYRARRGRRDWVEFTTSDSSDGSYALPSILGIDDL